VRLPRIIPYAVAAVLVAVALLEPSPAAAQAGLRVRVVRATVVMEWPRGDSVVLGRLDPGAVLEILQESGRWIQVTAAAGAPAYPWRRGWIPLADVAFIDAPPAPPAARRGDFMVRGFGQYGGSLFSARDSFEAILDSALGAVYGGGAQLVFPNGLFVQGGVERFEKTGTRVVVSDTQVFRVAIPNKVTVTPVQVTVGYRDWRLDRATGYAGAGVGWHVLEETSPALPPDGGLREGHLGYHVTGGAEFRIGPFLWLVGELQWATVPDGLGATGVGVVFEETDLGALTFRFKVMVGR
jgi:hypothetical protein